MKLRKTLMVALLALMTPMFLFAKKSKLATLNFGDIVLEPEDSLMFVCDELPDEIGGYEVMSEYLPSGVEVVWTGKKFKLPKAGKVKYSKKEGDFITTNDENPCGVKLSINKKTGKIKGSFKVYVMKSEKKVKSYTAKVTGYVGAEEIYVTIKKVGTFVGMLD